MSSIPRWSSAPWISCVRRSGESVLDLYCGLGNFSLPLARSGAHVVGVEGDASLIARARANAELNGLVQNSEFFAANLADESVRRRIVGEAQLPQGPARPPACRRKGDPVHHCALGGRNSAVRFLSSRKSRPRRRRSRTRARLCAQGGRRDGYVSAHGARRVHRAVYARGALSEARGGKIFWLQPVNWPRRSNRPAVRRLSGQRPSYAHESRAA